MSAIALTEAELTEALEQLNGWERDGDELTKTFAFPHYMAGIAFVGAVATIAEGFNHHPDIVVLYKKVKVSFTTHDAGSKITANDVNCAKAIDALNYPKES